MHDAMCIAHTLTEKGGAEKTRGLRLYGESGVVMQGPSRALQSRAPFSKVCRATARAMKVTDDGHILKNADEGAEPQCTCDSTFDCTSYECTFVDADTHENQGRPRLRLPRRHATPKSAQYEVERARAGIDIARPTARTRSLQTTVCKSTLCSATASTALKRRASA
jgi:hypothetical protein